jgi:hypothetical protein
MKLNTYLDVYLQIYSATQVTQFLWNIVLFGIMQNCLLFKSPEPICPDARN